MLISNRKEIFGQLNDIGWLDLYIRNSQSVLYDKDDCNNYAKKRVGLKEFPSKEGQHNLWKRSYKCFKPNLYVDEFSHWNF